VTEARFSPALPADLVRFRSLAAALALFPLTAVGLSSCTSPVVVPVTSSDPSPQERPARIQFPPDLPKLERPAEARVPSGLPASVEVKKSGSRFKVTFRYEPGQHIPGGEKLNSVSLVGTFNGWAGGAMPMKKQGRVWQTTVELGSGNHEYKFLADGDWRPDPENPDGSPDGHGGQNSLLRLGALANIGAGDGEVGNGEIVAVACEHDPEQAIYRELGPDGGVSLRYRTLVDDVEEVHWHLEGAEPVAMTKVVDGERFTWWETRADRAQVGQRYTFSLKDGNAHLRHDSIYELEVADEPFVTPDWAKDAIWYQIMPERFRNGDTANDPDNAIPWTHSWYEPTEWERSGGQSFYNYYVFSRLYGGDFQGLEEKLDYLSDLGINAIYFNPIFQASTHHRYNATNFLHVDERLGVRGDYAEAERTEDLTRPSTWTWTGSDKVFLEFLQACKQRGIRVILDGVFNHVGTLHPAFRDVQEKGQKSKYKDWFEITSWEPFEYAGWAGFGELPVFKKTATGLYDEDLKEHIFEVTRRWMDPDGDGDPSDGIDGWRLDVPNELPMPFWYEWREVVKGVNPDAYISGEIWRRADQWLDGKSFDAVMNYVFAENVIRWVGDKRRKISTSELDRNLAELRLAYPAEATYVLMNLMNSHDTDRLVSMLTNPDREFDGGNREQDGARYNANKPGEKAYAQARLIALLQMTYVGAPMVYYGDEVGMWGSDDPNNRKPMIWGDLEPYDDPEQTVDAEHHAYYRDVIRLRREHATLRRGSFRTLVTDDAQDVWVFERELDGETLVVAINAGEGAARIRSSELNGNFTELHGPRGQGEGFDLSGELVLEALSGQVLRRTSN
jgi:glycosidase